MDQFLCSAQIRAGRNSEFRGFWRSEFRLPNSEKQNFKFRPALAQIIFPFSMANWVLSPFSMANSPGNENNGIQVVLGLGISVERYSTLVVKI